MSKCISSYGEYSEHTEVNPGDGVCGYCGDVDLDSIRAKAWDEGRAHGAMWPYGHRGLATDDNPYRKEATDDHA